MASGRWALLVLARVVLAWVDGIKPLTDASSDAMALIDLDGALIDLDGAITSGAQPLLCAAL